MKKYTRKISILAIAMVLVLTSVITFNIIKKHGGAEEPEIMVSRGYEQVNPGDEKIDGTDFVTFDAFYLRDLDGDGYAEKIRGSCREIGKSDTIYMDLNVLTNGTLKNGKITINGKNFNFVSALVKDSVIAQNYIGTNIREIKLNDVSSGTQKLIFGMSRANLKNNINNYSVTDNSITLTGTHVADDGTETPISKTVYFTNDWYGSTRTELDSKYLEQEYDINDAIDVENSVLNIKFKINPKEKDEELILKNQHVDLVVPELAGYKAIEVKVDNGRAVVNYDMENGVATIDYDSVVAGSGAVAKTISRDITYEITYVYPLQAYIDADTNGFTLNIPIDATFTGYNNDDFWNPYESNIAEQVISVLYGTPQGQNALVEIKVGEYLSEKSKYVISKEKPINIYNNVESETEQDLYTVRWILSTGTEALNVPVLLNEPTENYIDQFMDINANYTDMNIYTKNVGVYFSGQEKMLGEDGYINVFNDETDELLHTFTSADWEIYTKSNPYVYSEPVEHIRVETSNVLKTSVFYVYNVKELNDLKITTDYERVEFDKLAEIYSHVHAKMQVGENEYFDLNTASSYASYMEPYSEAKISISENNISNQQTTKNFEMNITTYSNEYVKKKFANGVFLIKYPEEIIDVEINRVQSNDSSVEILGYDTYEENGFFYTKIYTSNDTEKDLDIQVLANITADPRCETVTKPVELYYYNPTAHNYYESTRVVDTYDINDNENTEEYVGKAKADLNIYAPSTLLTSQTATDYDDLDSIAIAPQDAIIDKVNGEKTAKINVNITNNYSNTISEVKIVGKIPFEGNTYQLNGSNLGSTYSTTLTENGIVVPDDLQPYATIYYSEKEKVTPDITARRNAWTTTPSDMSKVKSYLIDLGNYIMPVDNSKTFTYTVTVPTGLNYNDVSYSDHAVYFCLDTNEGKLNTQTEPNKLGIKIALKYDLEITKYQKNKTLPIAGVVFGATDSETGETKVATTYSTGIATLKNLYVEKEYKIKEIRTDSNYVLDDTETTIIAHIVDGHIELEVTGGNFKTTPILEEVANGNDKFKTIIENEVKYTVELDKTQLGTNDAIQGIRFELTDYNGRKRNYTTNKEGKLVLKKLEPDKQYTLTEIDSKGHYVKNPVTFMMIRDVNGNLQFNVISGELDSLPQLDVTDEIPKVTTGLVNEKIPIYTLKVTKKEADTENIILGAQFKLEGENKSGNTLYASDTNGQFEITDLYNYVDGRDITGEYTLTEVYPGEGYILNDIPIKFRVIKNGEDYTFDLIEGSIRENVEDVQIDTTDINNPVVNITIDNEPVFTLTKIDEETGEPLEGVMFSVTDFDGNDALTSKDNYTYYNDRENLTLTSLGEYRWEKYNDEIWMSGNANINNSRSALISNEFVIPVNGTVYFGWAVSSEGSYNDYIYYQIIDVDNNKVVNTDKKYGNSDVSSVNNLSFSNARISLEAGRYKIKFEYVKNGSIHEGLDRGFVKNVYVNTYGTAVKTDKNGRIRLSLKQGLYKAAEVKPLEGYSYPNNNSIGIGIGESKEATYSFFEKWRNEEPNASARDFIANQDGTYYVMGTYNVWKVNSDGSNIWEVNIENLNGDDSGFDKILEKDGNVYAFGDYYYYVIDSNGTVIQKVNNDGRSWIDHEIIGDKVVNLSWEDLRYYDLDGNLINTFSYAKSDFILKTSSGVLLTDYKGNRMTKIDENGNFISQVDNSEYTSSVNTSSDIPIVIEDGIVIPYNDVLYKFDFDGNFIWAKGENELGFEPTNKLISLGDKFLVEYYGEFDQDKFYILDSDGDTITYYDTYHSIRKGKATSEYIYTLDNSGRIRKFDYNMNLVEKTIVDVPSYNRVLNTEDGILALEYNGRIRKFDYDGNLIWEYCDDEEKFDTFAVIENGVIIVNDSRDDEKMIKIDSNGNFVWKKSIRGDGMSTIIDVNDGFIIGDYMGPLTKYDYDGNIIWDKTISFSLLEAEYDEENDRALLVGYHYMKMINPENGEVIWETSPRDFDVDRNSFDGPILMVGDYTIVSDIFQTYMYKIDNSNGDVLLKKEFNDSYYDILRLCKHKDGFLMIAANGYLYEYDMDLNLISKKYIFESEFNPDNSLEISSYNDDGITVSYTNGVRYYNYDISEPEIQDSKNVIVSNSYIKYNITTGVRGYGGTISGKDDKPYESVKYKENSIKDIIATPANGYKVSQITINGENVDFTENPDGTVLLDKFYEMEEDKYIEVSFINKNRVLIINKLDSSSDEPLKDAKFNIKSIETREEPNISNIAGSVIANGKEYTEEEITLGEEITNVIGSINNQENAQYYFTLEGDTYVPNNSGVSSSTANSYFKIDLSGYSGNYAVVVNANVSSESSYDVGYATITESTTAPAYDSSTGQFIKISGTSSDVTTSKDYIKSLKGGKEYYLHIGYRKDSSADSGDDKFYVNSIKLYNADVQNIISTYNFVDNGNGGYESNNQGKSSTVANSYIPIDLTGYTGKYNLIVNANVSSQTYDYGYATISLSTDAPDYSTKTGQFIYISGTSSSVSTPKNYTTVIEGGKIYYLHMGYYKNDTTDSGDDKFTINSINITLNQDDFVDTEVTTDDYGKAYIQLTEGRYEITEINAPYGYTLNPNSIIHDYTNDGENEVTFRNNPQADLIVHHYIKGTTTPIADDEYIKGDLGTEYSTSPKTDLDRYQLEEDERGEYVIPENASGTFTEDTQVVTYYYVLKPLELIVHHYLDGTQDSVVPDEYRTGQEGESYTTHPATSPELDDRYELVETKLPENASGTLTEPVTEVTYYYKIIEHIITTEVIGIGGTISGQGLTQYEVVSHGEDSIKDIIATAGREYQIKNITINNQEIEIPDDKRLNYLVEKFINMTEDKHIVVEFELRKREYKVIKKWVDNNDELGKRPDSIEIQLYDSNNLVESNVVTKDDLYKEELPTIEFVPYGDNSWTQNDDDTWQSGNYNLDSSTSTLTSAEFRIEDGNTLSFDWSVSSESVRYDYLYYEIINVDTDTTIGGTNNKIGGTSYGLEYNELRFNHVDVELEPGNYIIKFTYRKDESVSDGLDCGFVKEVKINGETVGTDSNIWQTVFYVPLVDSNGIEINYTVTELEINADDLALYNENIVYGDKGATITNTFEIPDTKISIPVTKVWEDNSNANAKRPAQIKLQVKNGSEVVKEQVIDVSENSQTYTFENLPEYDSLGNTISYTIDEVEVNADDLKFYSKEVNQETKTITNTFTVPEEKTSVDVTKKWSDNSNGNNTRPAQIKLQVKNGTTIVQEQVVDVDNATNEKVYTFNDLAMYDNAGQVINYTVDEVEVNSGDLAGYTKGIDGLEITNTLKKHKITTEVNGVGGTISGQGEDPYEEVNHKGDSVKDIVITPAEGYKIKSITINDVPQDLPGNLEQPYTMSKFTNMTEDKHVVVEFELVEHVITTEVDGVGGTISGQGSTKQNPYETVLHGNDSVKDIVITPETGYKINSITINNVEQDLPNDVNSAYTLPKFINMTEDKHILVSFTHSETSVIVKHQTEDGTDLVPPETIEGVVGDDYTTSPRDFDDYELKTTPDNAEGTMTVEQIEVIYVYSKVLGKVTVTKQDKLHPETKINGAIFKLEKLDTNNEVDTSFEAIEKETTGEGENKGKAEFENLEVGKYRITEIKAPEGYELTGEPVDVEVTKAQRNIDIVASDRMTIDLPATGGINYTIIISVIGFGIMLSSAGILVFKKKQN